LRRLPTSTRALASRFFVPGLILLALATAAIAVFWVTRPFDAVRAEVAQEGLEHPWDIAFAPDGRMLVTERAGRVLVFESGAPGADRLHTATVPDVRAELESGLMGIAVSGATIFVCASRDPDGDGGEPWGVELLRSTLADDGSLAPFEVVGLGEPASGGPRHQGCAVEVGGGSLWVSIGDANRPAAQNRAQDPGSPNGKVLRLALDGSLPPDNPFGNAVYSLGHRNPQGLALGADGQFLAAEHGTDVNDEINAIVAGGNYGYPCYTGAGDPGPIPDGCQAASDYVAPAWASGSSTIATSGATFLTGVGWGDWTGNLVVSTLKEEDLRRFSVTPDGEVVLEETLLDGRFGRLRAVGIGPDGALYISTANGPGDRIVRVTR
jgi:glucose/arabinose dehydrogenase